MPDKSFFKPTNLYKEYMILDLIEKNKNITQRELASHLGIAVSMVNVLFYRIEKEGFIKRKKYNSKNVEYILTKKGIERRKILNIGYLKNSQLMYDYAKNNIIEFMNQLKLKGFASVFLYGFGEVAEIFLSTIYLSKFIEIKIIGVIDDDVKKMGKDIYGIPVVSINHIDKVIHDGILISSYTNRKKITDKLINYGYSLNKIIDFFN